MRLIAFLCAALVAWLITAMQVPSHERLPVEAVVLGAVVSQHFGCTSLELEPFDALCPYHHTHTGVDLAAPMGREVHSATAGIAYVGYDAMAGNFVAVMADSGVRVLYCHLSAYRVAIGKVVAPGQVIGVVGATGLATGPHVHLQVNVDGRPVDPAVFLGS